MRSPHYGGTTEVIANDYRLVISATLHHTATTTSNIWHDPRQVVNTNTLLL